jgi:hypothetical protein
MQFDSPAARMARNSTRRADLAAAAAVARASADLAAAGAAPKADRAGQMDSAVGTAGLAGFAAAQKDQRISRSVVSPPDLRMAGRRPPMEAKLSLDSGHGCPKRYP